MTELNDNAPDADGYIFIKIRARLWSMLPERDYPTPDQKAKYIQAHTRKDDSFYGSERLLKLFDEPECEIAVKSNLKEFPSKWLPCQVPPVDGGSRCSRHGGPRRTVEVATKQQLEAVNQELLRRVADLEARLAESVAGDAA